MQINQTFDSGNILVLEAEDPAAIRLAIREDQDSGFYQWFHFRVSGVRNTPLAFSLTNAGGAAYPDGFRNYKICYSYDRREWLRHPTHLQGEALLVEFTPQQDTVYFAYFAPYSWERHMDLVAAAQESAHCRHEVLGQTIDGRDLDLLRFSLNDGVARPNCWAIARQHPGETMAEWWMEGVIQSLVGGEQEALLQRCNLFLVPNMNPDGSVRGHLRTNAVGRNLNREWQSPTLQDSPEVLLVRNAADRHGVDFWLDVHGDESLPYCFIAGTEGLADWNDARQAQLDFYTGRLAEINPDFQTEQGYPVKAPGTANLTMSTAQIAQRHGCLAMTLEMPFKDTTATPDQRLGWSAERSGKLGLSCLKVLDEYLQSEVFA